MARRCMWSRNLVCEESIAPLEGCKIQTHNGLQRQQENKRQQIEVQAVLQDGWSLKQSYIYNTKAHLKFVFAEKNSGYDAMLSSIYVYRCFEGICCFHIQFVRRRMQQVTSKFSKFFSFTTTERLPHLLRFRLNSEMLTCCLSKAPSTLSVTLSDFTV